MKLDKPLNKLWKIYLVSLLQLLSISCQKSLNSDSRFIFLSHWIKTPDHNTLNQTAKTPRVHLQLHFTIKRHSASSRLLVFFCHINDVTFNNCPPPSTTFTSTYDVATRRNQSDKLCELLAFRVEPLKCQFSLVFVLPIRNNIQDNETN